MKTGLLSVTFRQLSPERIIELVARSGLQAIEWGGDLHVPHGDIAAAKEIGERTRSAGIEVASYGSYYFLQGTHGGESDKVRFEDVLQSAVALRAPAIRVWAGNRGSVDAPPEWRQEIAADARRIAGLAEAYGITIDFEYHRNTLTDHHESAVALLRDIGHPNVRCNWQTPEPGNFEASSPSLPAVLPWLGNVHVFHWSNGERLNLAAGRSDWLHYVAAIRQAGKSPYLMLEFVKDDDPLQFLEDAKALSGIVG